MKQEIPTMYNSRQQFHPHSWIPRGTHPPQNTHFYSFTFQVGKIRPPIRICSQELADEMANLDTFLISRDVLWGENLNGLQDVLSGGSIHPYIPDGNNKVYFEASSTIPGFGTGGTLLMQQQNKCIPSKTIDNHPQQATIVEEQHTRWKPKIGCHPTTKTEQTFSDPILPHNLKQPSS